MPPKRLKSTRRKSPPNEGCGCRGSGTGTGEAEDLGQLEIWLGFGHSGEVVEDEIGQAEVECVGIDGNAVAVSGGRGEEAELGGDVLLAGESLRT